MSVSSHSQQCQADNLLGPVGDSSDDTPPAGGAGALVIRVETDDTDDASESSALLHPVHKPEAVVLDLFFFGRGGRIRPGNSVFNRL